MPGPPPKPTALRIIQGNPGRRPLPQNEPKPTLKLPPPPKDMSAAARKHWRKVGRQLLDAGIMTVIDADALQAYCEAYARWSAAQAMIRKSGMLVKAPSGYPILSPYLGIANKAFEQMAKLLGEFGMTPASRSRLRAENKDSDQWDAYFDDK